MGADRGIHVLYFREPRLQDLVEELLEGDLLRHDKRCVIDSGGVRTPFPFHANLFGRPLDVVEECLAGLWEASLRRNPDTPDATVDICRLDRSQLRTGRLPAFHGSVQHRRCGTSHRQKWDVTGSRTSSRP